MQVITAVMNEDVEVVAAPTPSSVGAVPLAGLLFLLVAIAYAPALGAGFIWDDDAYVLENPTLRSHAGLRQIWFEPGTTPQYYPFVFTSYWLEYQIWQLAPFGYHLNNVVLHLLSALLLWWLLARLGVPGAWLAAAVFALHPVHVESVAWVTERKNVLSGLFYLAAMLSLLRFAPVQDHDAGEDSEQSFAWSWYGLAGVFFLAALLSKTVTASLPAAFLVIHWWKRGRLSTGLIASMIPLLLIGAGAGLATAWLETAHVGAAGDEWSLNAWERVLVAGRALCFYATKLVWPFGLSFIYPRWQIDGGQVWQALYPIGVMGLGLFCWLRRSQLGRGPIAGLLFFAGTLFPALGFLDVFPHRFSYVADHFQYLASLGVLVPLVAGLSRILQRRSVQLRWGIGAALLLLLATLTFLHARDFHDPETLWRDTLMHNPDSYLANSHMGTICNDRGELRGALAYYREALRIKPEDPLALNNLAWLLATADDPAVRSGVDAVPLAEEAAERTQFGVPGILDTLAASYAAAGQFGRAEEVARQAFAIAEAAGLEESAAELRARVELYRRRRPFIDRSGAPVAGSS